MQVKALVCFRWIPLRDFTKSTKNDLQKLLNVPMTKADLSCMMLLYDAYVIGNIHLIW